MGSKRPRTPDLTALPPRLLPYLHEPIRPGILEAELWSNALPSVPDEEEATDSVGATSTSGITPESQSGQPPAKKQRIKCECALCGTSFTERKSLYRHQKRCKDHCAQSNTSPESHQCGECGEVCSRLDVLQRHVQSTHQGQPRRRPQGSGNAPQRISFDTALESQGSEPQPQVMNTTTPGLWKDSSFVFTLQDPTTCYTDAVSYSDTVITTFVPATYEHHAQIYSQAFTTPAAVPDLQSFGYGTISSEDDWSPDQNSISREGTSVSNDLTPATSKSSAASSAPEVATKSDGDTDDDADLAALADRSLNFLDVAYASANPVSRGRNLRPNQIRFPTPCPLCGDELGNGPNDNGEIKIHLERHRSRMEAITYNTVDDSEAVCFVCQIHFLDIRDFRRHQESVRTGRGCGFEFHHYDTKCNGHHPRKFRTYENPDHLRFEEALRHWEGFQRRAFVEYFNVYMKGTAPTNARSHGEIPRRRAFAEYLEAHSKGMAPTDAQHTYRRSTGSLYSVMSRKSIRSTFTTPVRFRYGGEVKSNSSGLTRQRLADFIRDLAEAYENEELDVIKSLFSNSPLSTLQNVSENDLRVEWDFSWFYPDLKIERVKCLQFMVEQGLNPKLSSVQHLAIQLDLNMAHLELGAARAMPLLFEENAPLAVQSRLTQYAFLFAVSRGPIELVSKLLEQGILDTSSEMPDAGFIQGIREPNVCFEGPPPNGSIANTGEDLGTCALILALGRRQYQAASLLLEYGVESQRGIYYLVTSESAMQNLHRRLEYFHGPQDDEMPIPGYLRLLQIRLLGPATELASITSSSYLVLNDGSS
jgi:hypothetical protein